MQHLRILHALDAVVMQPYIKSLCIILVRFFLVSLNRCPNTLTLKTLTSLLQDEDKNKEIYPKEPRKHQIRRWPYGTPVKILVKLPLRLVSTCASFFNSRVIEVVRDIYPKSLTNIFKQCEKRPIYQRSFNLTTIYICILP